MSSCEEAMGTFAKSSVTFLVILALGVLVDKMFPIPDISECCDMLKDAFFDLLAIFHQSGRNDSYRNKENFATEEEEICPEEYKQSLIQVSNLTDYQQLWKERPELFRESEWIPIVNVNTPEGKQEIIKYEMVSNKKIGIVYRSPYNMMIVDLIRGKNGSYYTYERLMPTVAKGAVVIMPTYQGKFVLLNQFRHSMREDQIAFPRGFGDVDETGKMIDPEENVRKELSEEIGADLSGTPTLLGQVVADSGICGNKVDVYTVSIDSYQLKEGYEGIKQIVLLSKAEFEQEISCGKINDGYSLAAYALLTTLIK